MIETFDQFEFFSTLIAIASPDWIVKDLGLVMGEYCYDIVLDAKVSIRVRSSIHEDGASAPVGEDSIRLWLLHHVTGTQLSKLPNSYVTRVPGWQVRLEDCIHLLASYRAMSGDCPNCQHPLWVYRSKTEGFNEDRLFTSCFDCKKTFHWLEDAPHGTLTPFEGVYFEPSAEPSISIEVELDGTSNPLPSDEAAIPGPEAVEGGGRTEVARSAPEVPESSASVEAEETLDDLDQIDALDALEEEEVEEESATTVPTVERTPNPEQAEAIFAPLEGAYRVLAPPGSGKTFLLIRRIRHLLDSGVNMANILAVTFNKTMADELYNRLVALMPEMAENNWASRNICTIHAACYRMLHDTGDKRVYPDREMWKIKSFLQEQSIQYWPDEIERPSWKEIIDWIYTAKHEGCEQLEFGDFFFRHFPDHAQAITQLRIKLDDFLRVNGWMLFGDMTYDVEMKMRHDPVFARRFRTLYKYILVDEGQDTSGQAMRILTSLAMPQDNFFIVGDTDQLLYRFAGATPELNLYNGFEDRFPGGKLIKLSTNYRSTKAIIQACNHLIRWNYDEHGGPYGQIYMKDVQPREDAEIGQPIDFQVVDSPEEEADRAVYEITALMAIGYKPQDFFIGARTRAQLAYLEPYLMEAEIPYINLAGTSFWDSRHIQDMVAFLKVCSNPYDEEAFSRIYNIASNSFVHPWGDQKGEYCTHHYLPRVMLVEVKNFHNAQVGVRGYRFPWKYSWKPGLEDMVDLVGEMQATLATEGLSASLQFLANNCYLKFLLKELGLDDEGDGGPVDDINTLIAFSQDFKSASEFITWVEKAREQAKKASERSWNDSVVISTVHRLKGLERKVVIGIGLGEGFKPNPLGGTDPVGLLPHTFSLIPPPVFGVLPGRGQGRVEDERCIAFVLVSRAMERVILSTPSKYQGLHLDPSRFITELGGQQDERSAL